MVNEFKDKRVSKILHYKQVHLYNAAWTLTYTLIGSPWQAVLQ